MGVMGKSVARLGQMSGICAWLACAVVTEAKAQSAVPIPQPAMQAASQGRVVVKTVLPPPASIVAQPAMATQSTSSDVSALATAASAPVVGARGNTSPSRTSVLPTGVGEHVESVIIGGGVSGSVLGTPDQIAANSQGNNGGNSTPTAASLQHGGAVTSDKVLESILNCPDQRLTYNPLPPIVAGGYTDVTVDDSGSTVVKAKPWPTTAPGVNKLMGNIATSIASKSNTSKWTLGSIFGLNTSNSQYVIDFMKYRLEPLVANGTNLGWARVGAGMRIVVNLTKDDGSASGGIWALAASVSASKVKGTMSTELIGMDSPETTAAMPFTVDLSDGNIQKLIEALAVVKMKLYDPNTTVTPMLIATVKCAADASAVASNN